MDVLLIKQQLGNITENVKYAIIHNHIYLVPSLMEFVIIGAELSLSSRTEAHLFW